MMKRFLFFLRRQKDVKVSTGTYIGVGMGVLLEMISLVEHTAKMNVEKKISLRKSVLESLHKSLHIPEEETTNEQQND